MGKRMAARRGAKLALLTALGCLLILLVAVFCLRQEIREGFWILKLRSEEGAARIEAAGRLGEIGSAWGAEALLESLGKRDGDFSDHAVEALGRIYARVGAGAQSRVVEGLFKALEEAREAAERGSPDKGVEFFKIASELVWLDPLPAGSIPFLIQRLDGPRTADLAAFLLARGWPGSRSELERSSDEGSVKRLKIFYLQVQKLASLKPQWMAQAPSSAPIQEISRSFAVNHPSPEVRALSLSSPRAARAFPASLRFSRMRSSATRTPW